MAAVSLWNPTGSSIEDLWNRQREFLHIAVLNLAERSCITDRVPIFARLMLRRSSFVCMALPTGALRVESVCSAFGMSHQCHEGNLHVWWSHYILRMR